jgi:hypothetical protein
MVYAVQTLYGLIVPGFPAAYPGAAVSIDLSLVSTWAVDAAGAFSGTLLPLWILPTMLDTHARTRAHRRGRAPARRRMLSHGLLGQKSKHKGAQVGGWWPLPAFSCVSAFLANIKQV